MFVVRKKTVTEAAGGGAKYLPQIRKARSSGDVGDLAGGSADAVLVAEISRTESPAKPNGRTR